MTQSFFPLLIGMAFFLAIAIYGVSRYTASVQVEQLWTKSIGGNFTRAKGKPTFIDKFYADVGHLCESIGRPDLKNRMYQISFALPFVVFILVAVSRMWFLLLLSPTAFFLPWYILKQRYTITQFMLRRQLREARMMLAFLSKAGSPLEDAIVVVARASKFPLRDHLEDVCNAIGFPIYDHGSDEQSDMRVKTVVEAFADLANKVKLPEMTQFTQILSEGTRYDLAMSETLLHSLDVEKNVRDADAEQAFGKAQSKMTYLMAFMVALPTFMFLIFAAVEYFLHIMSGGGLGGMMAFM